mmetsp:Transcript_17210/g.26083  ORF Transcript_17210/g.26083 Transcript_17210/m.26083 type:complete len:243 (+) Transcript_17210:128-856(+)|eukprot:CAMPEP_0178919910 /NCGR_PEP_ID=MMETSP0786-20121207/14704_1 /TAXON_ID=186022 /ORGANISM="Thalassionema frauenfeldii, Strain CCMP 1798" /LENGTH=242 /DNA_ID=CAMNT_0020593903 /DNA_START=97 /DNA_END=825 /DNA_ORIENTATION=+
MKVRLTFLTLSLLCYSEAFAPARKAGSQISTELFQNVLEGRKIGGEINPVNNFILVKIIGKKDASDGGILLTGSAMEEKTRGKVIAVGPGKTHQETGRVFEVPVQPGDGVVYGQYDGTEINFNGEPHMLIRDDNVLIKYEGEKLTLDSVDVVRDRVLVKIDDDEQATAGGVILATSSSQESRPSTGTVMKVGEGAMAGDGSLLPIHLSVGEKVKYMDFAGNEVEIEGEEYSVVKMAEIVAKF